MKDLDFSFQALVAEEANNYFIPIIQEHARAIDREIEKINDLLEKERFTEEDINLFKL